jgi:hypothetical protein
MRPWDATTRCAINDEQLQDRKLSEKNPLRKYFPAI